jgi:hypothetical protein
MARFRDLEESLRVALATAAAAETARIKELERQVWESPSQDGTFEAKILALQNQLDIANAANAVTAADVADATAARLAAANASRIAAANATAAASAKAAADRLAIANAARATAEKLAAVAAAPVLPPFGDQIRDLQQRLAVAQAAAAASEANVLASAQLVANAAAVPGPVGAAPSWPSFVTELVRQAGLLAEAKDDSEGTFYEEYETAAVRKKLQRAGFIPLTSLLAKHEKGERSQLIMLAGVTMESVVEDKALPVSLEQFYLCWNRLSEGLAKYHPAMSLMLSKHLVQLGSFRLAGHSLQSTLKYSRHVRQRRQGPTADFNVVDQEAVVMFLSGRSVDTVVYPSYQHSTIVPFPWQPAPSGGQAPDGRADRAAPAPRGSRGACFQFMKGEPCSVLPCVFRHHCPVCPGNLAHSYAQCPRKSDPKSVRLAQRLGL